MHITRPAAAMISLCLAMTITTLFATAFGFQFFPARGSHTPLVVLEILV